MQLCPWAVSAAWNVHPSHPQTHLSGPSPWAVSWNCPRRSLSCVHRVLFWTSPPTGLFHASCLLTHLSPLGDHRAVSGPTPLGAQMLPGSTQADSWRMCLSGISMRDPKPPNVHLVQMKRSSLPAPGGFAGGLRLAPLFESPIASPTHAAFRSIRMGNRRGSVGAPVYPSGH